MLSVTDFKSRNSDLITSDKRIVLAYSGGLDSAALLHLLASSIDHSRLLIWHINHNLQKCALEMELFCADQADLYSLSFKATRLDLSHIKSNIEAQARDARYTVFSKELDSHSDILLTAHHADDHVESMLLNLCRGTGISGLRGIGRDVTLKNVLTIRPLIFYSRSEIKDYAKNNAIVWFDDPSNASNIFDRNYIRHDIVPLFKKRWPSINRSFQQVAAHQKEAQDCLKELAEIDYDECSNSNEHSQIATLKINELKKCSIARQKNLIRYWLKESGRAISMNQLLLVMHVIESYKEEFKQALIPAGFIGLFNNEMFLVSDDDIKEKEKVLRWLEGQEGNYVCRFNKNEFSISGHFLKRQFQSKKIPPWLRDQTVFLLDQSDSKQIVETIVL